jgi:hypothetical protein
LAKRYTNYFNLLIQNVRMVFYAGDGLIRSVTEINDTKVAPYPEYERRTLQFTYHNSGIIQMGVAEVLVT